MLNRSGIGSEVVAQNSIPDDPYQPLGEEVQAFVSPNIRTGSKNANLTAVRVSREPQCKVHLTTY